MKFTLEVKKGKAGLWHVTSPELTGLFVADRNLHDALCMVVPAGTDMLEAMRDGEATTDKARKQREAFRPIFGELPHGMLTDPSSPHGTKEDK